MSIIAAAAAASADRSLDRKFSCDDVHKLEFHWKLEEDLKKRLAGFYICYGSFEDVNACLQEHDLYKVVFHHHRAVFRFSSLKNCEPNSLILCSFRILQHRHPGFVLFKSIAVDEEAKIQRIQPLTISARSIHE